MQPSNNNISDALARLQSLNPAEREAAIHTLETTTDPQAVAALKDIYQFDADSKMRDLAKQAAQRIQDNVKQYGWNAIVPANAAPPAPTPAASTVPPATPVVPPAPPVLPPVGSTPVTPVGKAQASSNPNDRVFQMLWDCRFCGTQKLLGVDHRHCPNCGAAQDPSWRYFPSEADKKIITNPKYAYAGTDKICPACGQPNSAAANFCKDCGADLSTAKEAVRQDNLHLMAGQTAAGVANDVTKKKFQAEQAAIKAKTARRGPSKLKLLLIAIVAVVLIVGGGLFFLSKSTYGSSASVSQVTWTRTIRVEQLTAQSSSDWRENVPSDAYSLSCHADQKCHNESEQYVCGSTNVDRGDGSFSQQDKYCSRDKQVCENDDKCNYTVNRWLFEQDLTATGGQNDPLQWPNFTPLQTSGVGAERDGGRTEKLNVIFADTAAKDKTYTYNPTDAAVWQSFKPGQVYSLSINRLNQPQWNTLKLVSAQ